MTDTAPEEAKARRNPHDAEYITRLQRAAVRALENVGDRRLWADSKWGSPVVTLELCSEIARLNIERESLREALADFTKFFRGYCGNLNTRGVGIEISRLCGNAEAALQPGGPRNGE